MVDQTTLQDANVEAIKRFFDGISNKDVEAVLSFYDADCEFTAPEPLPWGGTYRGHDGIKELFATFMPYWKEIEEYAERIVSSGDDLMAVVRQRGVTRTDTPYDGVLALHFAMRDGKAVRGRGFADTASVLRAVGAEPRA
jgi:ketosteroid isomerase-like protein